MVRAYTHGTGSGRRLGAYDILGPLGAGGMGEVLPARDTKLGREVALKLLPDSVSQQPDRLARFEREARLLVVRGETTTEILAAVLNTEPDWNALATDTPPAITALLRRCLCKEAAQRMRHIADVRPAIEDACQDDLPALLIRRSFFRVVDHDHLNLPLAPFEFQAQLLLERRHHGRA
jgi:hypothetical protein